MKWMSLRAAHAVLAGLQVLTAGTALADLMGERPAGLMVLMVGACQVALAAYQAGQTPAPVPPPASVSGALDAPTQFVPTVPAKQ